MVQFPCTTVFEPGLFQIDWVCANTTAAHHHHDPGRLAQGAAVLPQNGDSGTPYCSTL
jgi:hypothetical protein